MRWLLGRDPGSCDACGADLERGAAWCGACGARTDGAGADGADEAAVATEPDAPEDGGAVAAPRWARHRQVLVAVLVLAVVAVVVAVQPRDEPAEPLLGQLSQYTGMSATGPPPSGLRLAWAHEPPTSGDSRVNFGPPRHVTVGDGRIRLGGHVLDLGTGDLVRVAAPGADAGTEWAIVESGELVVLDTVTGEVEHRAAVTDDWPDRNPWSIRRWGGVSLFGIERGSVLVEDDGSVIAEVDGTLFDHIDRAVATPAAFPVRGLPTGDSDALTAPVRLVATATGEVLLDLADGRARVVDVVGDRGMVAETVAPIDAVTSPAATSEVPWTVQLLDAQTGEERAELDVSSREPPRLLGTFGDGTEVVATGSGDDVPVWAVAPDWTVSTIARAESPPRRTHTGMWPESMALNAAVVTGDVLVVSAGDDGLVGLDRTGQRLWTLDAPTFAGLRADGGYVAVLPGDGGRIRVVRAADGEVVASLPTPTWQWDVASTPMAALAGHVGLGAADVFTDQEMTLGATTWLDLRTGEPATLEDVFAPFLPGISADGVDRSWLLHGTAPTAVDGGPAHASGTAEEPDGTEPVLTRSRPGGVLELLEPDDGLTQFALPVPEGVDEFSRGIRSLGATADLMAVWSEGFDNPREMAVHVLDRTTGGVRTLQGLQGIALVDDLLLAAEIDETWTMATLVGIDAVTGHQRWSGPPLGAFRGLLTPRVDSELLVDLGVARVTARSLRDGARVWTHASGTELTDHSVLGPGHVVVATTAGELVALDRDDGEVAWRTPVGIPIASMTGAGDHVLVGTHDGLVIHLDGRGREVQRIVVGSVPVNAVAALGDTVVATVGERVVALRADGTGITRNDEVDLP